MRVEHIQGVASDTEWPGTGLPAISIVYFQRPVNRTKACLEINRPQVGLLLLQGFAYLP